MAVVKCSEQIFTWSHTVRVAWRTPLRVSIFVSSPTLESRFSFGIVQWTRARPQPKIPTRLENGKTSVRSRFGPREPLPIRRPTSSRNGRYWKSRTPRTRDRVAQVARVWSVRHVPGQGGRTCYGIVVCTVTSTLFVVARCLRLPPRLCRTRNQQRNKLSRWTKMEKYATGAQWDEINNNWPAISPDFKNCKVLCFIDDCLPPRRDRRP